jgi:hypothetical protein
MEATCFYGFRKNGIEKLAYIEHYGEFESEGQLMIEFIEEIADINKMNAIFDKIVMVDEDDIITEQQATQMNDALDKANTMISSAGFENDVYQIIQRRNKPIQSGDTFYNQLHQFRGDLSVFIDTDFNVLVSPSITADEVYFFYIIDLDTNELDIRGDYINDEEYGDTTDVETKIDLQTIINIPGLDLDAFLKSKDTYAVSVKKTQIKRIFNTN